MRFRALGVLGLVLFAACAEQEDPPMDQEIVFILNDSTHANFPISQQNTGFVLQNGGEAMRLESVNDSTYVVPVFGGSWVLDTGGSTGVWTDSLRSSDYHVDFQIQPQATRSNRGEVPQGTWDVWFGDTDTLQPAEAQLDLTLKDGLLVGTIRTPTGDYRFFSGTCEEGVLHMQTYDGAHLYCVEAQLMNNRWVHGQFYSGNHYHTNWSATPGEVWVTDGVVELVQASETDLLINSFNAQGDPIQVSLVPLDNEVVVVDILGTWCPNCMDEVRLLRKLRDNHPHIRVVSLAYERDTVPNDVFRRLAFYETQLDIDWEVYWGGRASKSVAASTFPFLHEVISFPTTLFIHPNGTVAIHSGFNGPATGAAYEQEKLRFNRLVATDLSL